MCSFSYFFVFFGFVIAYDQFGFVGIYEEFDETMVMLKHFAGFTNVFYNHTKSVLGRPSAKGLLLD